MLHRKQASELIVVGRIVFGVGFAIKRLMDLFGDESQFNSTPTASHTCFPSTIRRAFVSNMSRSVPVVDRREYSN